MYMLAAALTCLLIDRRQQSHQMDRPSAWYLVATLLLVHSAVVPAAALQGIRGDLRLQLPSIAQEARFKARQILEDGAFSPPPPPPPPPPPSDSSESSEMSPSPPARPLLTPQAANPSAGALPAENLGHSVQQQYHRRPSCLRHLQQTRRCPAPPTWCSDCTTMPARNTRTRRRSAGAPSCRQGR